MSSQKTKAEPTGEPTAPSAATGRGNASQFLTAAFCFAAAGGLIVMLLVVPELEGVWAAGVAAVAFAAVGTVRLRAALTVLPRGGTERTASDSVASPAPLAAEVAREPVFPADVVPRARNTTPGRRVGIAVISVVAVAACCGVLAALTIGGGATPQPIADPGPVVRWGLPLMKAVQTLAAATAIGAVVLTSFALRPDEPEHDRAMDVAAAAAAVWTVTSGVSLVFAFLSLVPTTITDPAFSSNLGYFASEISVGRAWMLTTLIAAIVTVVALVARRAGPVAVVAVLAMTGLVPLAATGHAAASADHDAAVVGIGLHVLAASVWVGGLVVLAVLRPIIPAGRVGIVVARFSTLALVCFLIVSISGVVSASFRLSGLSELWTPYGTVLLLKIGVLVLLGTAGAVHRGRLVRSLHAGARTARVFWGLIVAELALMGVASGLGAGLARTSPPTDTVPGGGDIPSELLTGRLLPPEPSVVNVLSEWEGSLLWPLMCTIALVVYLLGVRRVVAAGGLWPVGRTISWCAGAVGLLWVTNGGVAVYGTYLLSVDAVGVLVLVVVVPFLLVVARPVVLLTEAARRRNDGSRGALEWVEAVRNSAPLRVFGHPVVAALVAGLSLWGYFFTPVLEWAMRDAAVREILTVHFLIVGAALVSSALPGKAGLLLQVSGLRLLAPVVFLTFMAGVAALMAFGTADLGSGWFGALDQPWGRSAEQEQNRAAMWLWAGVGLLFVAQAWVIIRQARRTGTRSVRLSNADGVPRGK